MGSAFAARVLVFEVAAILCFADAAIAQSTSSHIGIPHYPCSISRVALSPDGELVVSAGANYDPKLRAWALQTGQKVWESQADARAVFNALEFDPVGKTVVSGSWNGGLDVWDAATGLHLQSVTISSRTDTGVDTIAFSKDGRFLGVSTQTAKTFIYSVEDWKQVAELQGSGIVASLAFSPDGRSVATAGFGAVKVWDLVSGRLLRSYPIRPGQAPRVFMDRDEKLAQLWRMVWQVAFSHNGKSFASGTDGYIQVWDLATGRERAFTKTGGRPGSLTFSADDLSVGWGSWNGEVKVWRVGSTAQVTAKINSDFGHVSFSADFTHVLVPDGKMTINMVDLPTGRVTNSIVCNDKQ